MITTHQTKSSKSLCTLVFEITGMTLTVRAGTFKLLDEDLELLEDHQYVMPANVDSRGVGIGIMKNKSTGAISIGVDDVIDDGVDVMWKPDPSDADDMIHLLAKGNVQANATDADAEGWWELWHILDEPVPA